MISKETIKEFQAVVAEEYGRTITTEEAESIVRDATKYFDLLSKIANRSNWSPKFGCLEVLDMHDAISPFQDSKIATCFS